MSRLTLLDLDIPSSFEYPTLTPSSTLVKIEVYTAINPLTMTSPVGLDIADSSSSEYSTIPSLALASLYDFASESSLKYSVLSDVTGPASTEQSTTTSSPLTFIKLPTEVQLQIFQNMDPVTSACLGLTNKKFYAIHKETHGIVPLIAHILLPPDTRSGRFLFHLLRAWMKGAGLRWSNAAGKFITSERRKKIKEEDNVWLIRNWEFGQGNIPSNAMKRKMSWLKKMEILKAERREGGWWEEGTWVKRREDGGEGPWSQLEMGYEEPVYMTRTDWW